MAAQLPPSMRSGGLLAPYGLPGHLVDFVEALRARGIAVGPSETVDAGLVLSVLPLLDRESVREGLACALLRRTAHRVTFDAMFDLWFPVAMGEKSAVDSDVSLPVTEDGQVDIDAVRALIAELLIDGSPEAIALSEIIAAELVTGLGRYESSNGPSFSAYQALKEVSPETLISKILAGLLGNSTTDSGNSSSEVARRTAAARVAEFRKTVERETKRRTAERLGREKVATYGVPKLTEQVDFLRASETELQALRKNIGPLARLLASRLAARRRRARAGSIDLRRTLRKSMSTGGVPIDLVQRKPRPARPELVILCDVSGSVAGFSHFTLLLVHALREQFSRVRIFAFVDNTDEVTRFFGSGADLSVAMSKMLQEATLVTFDGHSDY
ncbi:MAG: VWA domain-containing protein, partial [Mycobacteriaceae bacterium]